MFQGLKIKKHVATTGIRFLFLEELIIKFQGESFLRSLLMIKRCLNIENRH